MPTNPDSILIEDGILVTVDSRLRVIQGGSIVVEDGRIAARAIERCALPILQSQACFRNNEGAGDD